MEQKQLRKQSLRVPVWGLCTIRSTPIIPGRGDLPFLSLTLLFRDGRAATFQSNRSAFLSLKRSSLNPARGFEQQISARLSRVSPDPCSESCLAGLAGKLVGVQPCLALINSPTHFTHAHPNIFSVWFQCAQAQAPQSRAFHFHVPCMQYLTTAEFSLLTIPFFIRS